MATTKTERAGVGFSIARQSGTTLIEVRPHHDIIAALSGVQVSFELLNGISDQQARKILDVLNENVIGILIKTASDQKTVVAAG
jgi:hypothetical protein